MKSPKRSDNVVTKRPRVVRHVADVSAAYNGDCIPFEDSSDLEVTSVEELMAHPFHWAYLSDRETQEVLLEIYLARRRFMN